MEANSWRSAQGDGPAMDSAGAVDWRSQLQPEARQRIVNKIMETLKRHLPISVPEGLNELKKIAVRFEEKIYSAATSRQDYLRKISVKMLSMETKTQHTTTINPAVPNSGVVNQTSSDSASLGMPQVSPGQTLGIPNRQSLLASNLQSNTSAVQGSSGLPPSLPSVTGLTQSNISNVTQASNLQSMSGIPQGSVNNSVGQGAPSNTQRQMLGRQQQQQLMSQQQQQQQSQNPLMYQHQLQQQILKQKLQHNSPLQQQQQQSLLSPNQLQSAQQSLMQISSGLQSTMQQTQNATMQSTQQPGHQQNQQNQIQQSVPSLLQQHPQSVGRQQQSQPSIVQQTPLQQHATSISHPSTLSSQQQQLIGQQGNMSNMQQAQLLGQQNSMADIQQQQQRLPVQQSNLLSMQQQHQLMNQQNLSLHQQQQLGSQNNASGMQQQHQQLLGSLPNVSNMQSHQRSMHMQKNTAQQQQQQQQQQLQPHQSSLTMMQPQGQQSLQSQHQPSQQQIMSQFQSQPPQMQQQMPMQQQSNSLQREMHQRLQASNNLLQSQNAVEQKLFVQAQRALPEVSSGTSMDSTVQTGHAEATDWQEDCHQKIQSMKERYFTELSEFHQKIAQKLQQHEALMPHGKQSEEYDKLKSFKAMLERTLTLLQISKPNIPFGMKDKLPLYEKQIVTVLQNHIIKKATPQPQAQQFQYPGGSRSMPQQQPSQVTQLQQPDK